jgi:hypothetical protein
MFVKHNVNPMGKKTSDCVVRAIALVEGRPWEDVFDELVRLARQSYSMPNDTSVYGKYLDEKYPTIDVFRWVGGRKKRYTVRDVCQLKGTYIVRLAKHITVVMDGKYYDVWDCGSKCAYKIWKVN